MDIDPFLSSSDEEFNNLEPEDLYEIGCMMERCKDKLKHVNDSDYEDKREDFLEDRLDQLRDMRRIGRKKERKRLQLEELYLTGRVRDEDKKGRKKKRLAAEGSSRDKNVQKENMKGERTKRKAVTKTMNPRMRMKMEKGASRFGDDMDPDEIVESSDDNVGKGKKKGKKAPAKKKRRDSNGGLKVSGDGELDHISSSDAESEPDATKEELKAVPAKRKAGTKTTNPRMRMKKKKERGDDGEGASNKLQGKKKKNGSKGALRFGDDMDPDEMKKSPGESSNDDVENVPDEDVKKVQGQMKEKKLLEEGDEDRDSDEDSDQEEDQKKKKKSGKDGRKTRNEDYGSVSSIPVAAGVAVKERRPMKRSSIADWCNASTSKDGQMEEESTGSLQGQTPSKLMRQFCEKPSEEVISSIQSKAKLTEVGDADDIQFEKRG